MYPTLADPTQSLLMDIYYPSDRQAGKLLPAVIMANDFMMNGAWMQGNEELPNYYSAWCRILAINGIVGVTYDTLHPDDIDAVVKYIQENGPQLGIDGNRLGLFGSSSNGPPAGSFAEQENREYVKFLVLYYSYFKMSGQYTQEYKDFCKEVGCHLSELQEIKKLRTDLPLYVVRDGVDNPDIDSMVELATQAKVPLTLIKFVEGTHGFDFKDPNYTDEVVAKSIDIMNQTLDFMKAILFDQ